MMQSEDAYIYIYILNVKLQTYFYRGFPGKNSLEKLPTDQLPKDYRSLKRCLKFA